MNINMLLWWSLGRGNTVVPSLWQATSKRYGPVNMQADSATTIEHAPPFSSTDAGAGCRTKRLAVAACRCRIFGHVAARTSVLWFKRRSCGLLCFDPASGGSWRVRS